MKTTAASIAALAVGLALTAGAYAATPAGQSFTGHQYARDARISLSQARAIALKARPGSITDQELERERGGSGLRYSFDIAGAGRTYEVGIDARTGRVLENGHESATAEAAEH
jgi:uncharacterized membrane protein YkoI